LTTTEVDDSGAWLQVRHHVGCIRCCCAAAEK
jgi:hypothetical protein